MDNSSPDSPSPLPNPHWNAPLLILIWLAQLVLTLLFLGALLGPISYGFTIFIPFAVLMVPLALLITYEMLFSPALQTMSPQRYWRLERAKMIFVAALFLVVFFEVYLLEALFVGGWPSVWGFLAQVILAAGLGWGIFASPFLVGWRYAVRVRRRVERQEQEVGESEEGVGLLME